MGDFTSTEKKEIEKMFKQGFSVREISRNFKVKVSSMLKLLHKYKLYQHKYDYYNSDLLYKIRDLNNQGLLKNEICKKLNISIEKLNQYFHIVQNKCPASDFDRLGFTREDVLRVIALIEEGGTHAEVALKLGKKVGTVSKCANRLRSCGINIRKGKIKYSEGLTLPVLEDIVITPKTNNTKLSVDSQIKNSFMTLKFKGCTDEVVSKELNIDIETVKHLREQCAKHRIFFDN